MEIQRLKEIIEKQSKEIEELKEDKYGLEEEVQIQAKNIMLCENALCEIQDKIKAKIEEYKKEQEFYNKNEDREWGQFNNWDWIDRIINEMHSLLEKE